MISLLVVSKCEPHTDRFFTHYRAVADMLGIPWVLGCDRCSPPPCFKADKVFSVCCKTTVEDVLILAFRQCETEWVLRLDDDETLSLQALSWLYKWLQPPSQRSAKAMKAIAFHRANLWGGESLRLAEPGLYPDVQVRLVRRDHENRTRLHEGLDCDLVAPVDLLHYKFLIRSYEDRVKIADAYESTWKGAGYGPDYMKFNLPEKVFGQNPKTSVRLAM
jgi:hypothetical protein